MTHHVAEKGHVELEDEVEAVRPLDLADPTALRSILQRPPRRKGVDGDTNDAACQRRITRGVQRLGSNAWAPTLETYYFTVCEEHYSTFCWQ